MQGLRVSFKSVLTQKLLSNPWFASEKFLVQIRRSRNRLRRTRKIRIFPMNALRSTTRCKCVLGTPYPRWAGEKTTRRHFALAKWGSSVALSRGFCKALWGYKSSARWNNPSSSHTRKRTAGWEGGATGEARFGGSSVATESNLALQSEVEED